MLSCQFKKKDETLFRLAYVLGSDVGDGDPETSSRAVVADRLRQHGFTHPWRSVQQNWLPWMNFRLLEDDWTQNREHKTRVNDLFGIIITGDVFEADVRFSGQNALSQWVLQSLIILAADLFMHVQPNLVWPLTLILQARRRQYVLPYMWRGILFLRRDRVKVSKLFTCWPRFFRNGEDRTVADYSKLLLFIGGWLDLLLVYAVTAVFHLALLLFFANLGTVSLFLLWHGKKLIIIAICSLRFIWQRWESFLKHLIRTFLLILLGVLQDLC